MTADRPFTDEDRAKLELWRVFDAWWVSVEREFIALLRAEAIRQQAKQQEDGA